MNATPVNTAGNDGHDGSGPTAELAGFAADLDFAAIPGAVIDHAKLCLLDTVGCAIYGASLPWSAILRDTMSALNAAGPCGVWGTPHTTDCGYAALINGAAVHAFELDDLHAQSILHPGSVVVPAAIATGQQQGGLSGRDFLVGMIAGYEVGARAGISVGSAHLIQGWHPTGTHGTLAAAAAAGRVLGLTPERMTNALGIAGSQSAGLMGAQFSAMVKRMHAGRAAQSGVYSALLAANGYTGITDLFECGYGGYCGTFSPSHDLTKITAGLGEVWETANVGFKPYSANGSCHPTIDALLDLRAEFGLRPEHLDHADIYVSQATKEHVGWPYRPDSVTTAQMNLPYIFAVVLTDGDAFVAQFSERRIADPDLVALSQRVNVIADPAIGAKGEAYRHSTRMEFHHVDGTVHVRERQYARGHARLPMTAADVDAKYRKLVDGRLSDKQAERLRDAIASVDQMNDIAELATAMCVPAQPR